MFHEKEHISKEQTAYLRRTQKRKAAVWLLQVLLLILFSFFGKLPQTAVGLTPSFSASRRNYSQQPLK